MRGPALFVRKLIGVYQRVTAGAQPRCRFWPSCSAFADEALQVHGAWRGGLMAVRRLGRCHPWGGHGFDPVPAGSGGNTSSVTGAPGDARHVG